MGRVRAVVFDMDGLMFNTEDVYWEVGDAILRRRGHEFDDPLCVAMMGRPPRAAFEIMIRYHALSDSWEQLYVESQDEFIARLDSSLAPMPGLMDLLERLEQAQIPKAIGTSSGRRLVDAVLSRFHLQPRFQFILSAEDITRGKPDPEIYLKAAQRFELAPAEVLVLEDSQNGCQAAASAGTLAVAVPGDHSRGQDFSMATLVIDSLADARLYAALGLVQG
mgnify:FL=1